MRYFAEHPYRVFAWSVAGLLFLIVLTEGWRYAVKPGTKDARQYSVHTLDLVSHKFVYDQQTLLNETQDLANTLKNQLEQNQPRHLLFSSLQQYGRLWGSGLYQGQQPVVWNNFSLKPFQKVSSSGKTDSYVIVQKQDNVLLWIGHVYFTIQTEDGIVPYHLFTAKRIRQTNTLPIAGNSKFNLLENLPTNKLLSVDIGIYETVPADTINYRILQSLSGDSVGVAYTKANDLQEVMANWQQTNHFWRAIYALICYIVICFLLYIWLNKLAAWKSLFIQLIIILVSWFIFSQVHIAENWLPGLLEGMRTSRVHSYQTLCRFILDGLFALFIGWTLQQKLAVLRFKFHSTSFFSAILAACCTGLINIVAIVFTLKTCYNMVYATSIPVLTLKVFPGIGTLIFYLCLGIVLLALTMALFSINNFLLRSCKDYYKLVIVITTTSVVVGFLLAQLFIPNLLILSWTSIIALVYFGLVFFISFFYFRFPLNLSTTSPLRTAAIYSFIISLAGSTVIYQAKTHHIDTELVKNVQEYTQNKDPEARKLTGTLLQNLQQEFKTLTKDDLQNKISFVQARFAQTIQSSIPQKSRVYSFDLQMIDNDKNLLANYSTNLNSPGWVRVFNLRRLKTIIGIKKVTNNTILPYVQQPELENAEIYQTFYRGWIPIFENDDQQPIAWILCSVYRERPDFNKPMRAVMASLGYQDWENSYLIQQFKDNQLTKTIHKGVETHYPVYNVLQPAEKEALKNDSTLYFTNTDNKKMYRNLLVKRSSGRVIKCTTLIPGYQVIMFSFFRLSFTLLVSGFFILLILQWIGTGKLGFFRGNERFQDRILDSFLLTTLIFLVLLVLVTHFAIRRQNKDLVEQQLFEKLEPITQATERNETIFRQLNNRLNASLDSLTAPLNVDASFYENQLISESTTPQIYQQHLLPNALPYPIYSNLFLSQKRNALTTVILNGQELLIGFRSVLSDDDKPIAAIAIPTFVQSPKFNKQLLETTSFLIMLYLVIFGLFIIATALISRKLTRPLYYIQQGLNKISKGNLDTTIPVTSKDEIGSLAQAYNKMVSQLKQLQKELGKAEREEAWKEMAQQVAHEIKNPLTPMKLNIQHLERQLASGNYTIDELKEKVNKITQNLIAQIQSLNNIASDFSKFSKPIEEEFTSVNMNKLVNAIADLYNHDEEINIETNLSALASTVFGAKDELHRVIINLVKNAHEAMDHEGTIALKTHIRERSLFIEVEDNGIGISEEDKSKIFVPNFSTKSSGTGLGLAICKKVIEAHGGSISFASIKGKGTTFVVKLPLFEG